MPDRLLFVAERYAPSVGGEQSLNHDLYSQLKCVLPIYRITPGFYLKFDLQKFWFLPMVFWPAFSFAYVTMSPMYM